MADKNELRKAAEQDALLREVDEELRREQLAKLWENYGTYALAAAALIVVGVGGFKWWESRQIGLADAAGARYEAASRLLEEGKTEEAQKAFAEIAKAGPGGYRVLAELRVAAAEAKAGRTAQAVAAYEAVAARSGVDPLFAGFARLQTASLKLDTSDWTEMQNRLTPLAAENSPWRYSARELIGLAAWKAGLMEEARKAFEPLLADRRVPPSIGERAKIVMALIVADELAKAQPAPAKAEPAKSVAPAPAAEQKPAEQEKQ
jgi:hypothetical protein